MIRSFVLWVVLALVLPATPVLAASDEVVIASGARGRTYHGIYGPNLVKLLPAFKARQRSTEGSGENLFLVSRGELHTPPVTDNNLTGITRDSTFQLASKELGLKIVERHLRRSELYLADEVFLTGTAAHITPVGRIDNRDVGGGGVGPITKALRDMYADVVRGNNPKYMHWCSAVAMES